MFFGDEVFEGDGRSQLKGLVEHQQAAHAVEAKVAKTPTKLAIGRQRPRRTPKIHAQGPHHPLRVQPLLVTINQPHFVGRGRRVPQRAQMNAVFFGQRVCQGKQRRAVQTVLLGGRQNRKHLVDERAGRLAQLGVAKALHDARPEGHRLHLVDGEGQWRQINGFVDAVAHPRFAPNRHARRDKIGHIAVALNAEGKICDSALEQMEAAQSLFSLTPEDVMPSLPEVAASRAGIIAEINEQYATDYVKYLYFHCGWLYVDLTNHTADYVEEFSREHLGVQVPILPAVDHEIVASNDAITACHTAARLLRERSEHVSRYFYKRYRTLLWARLQGSEQAAAAGTARRMRETQFFIESWSEGDSDALTYLAQLAPLDLRELFPGRIEKQQLQDHVVAENLPTESDRRIFRHIQFGDIDEAAEATLYRLELLERTDVFRPVPAESMLELCRRLCRIRLDRGETIIWEGEVNDDVFFLTRGKIEVLVREDGEERRVGAVNVGEVFGEMAFFSRDVRGATARATEPSECFVIKDSDLLLLVFKHPSILMQMAGALTRRLARLNQHAAQNDAPVLSIRDDSLLGPRFLATPR